MGRDKRNERQVEHFTKLVRNMMETPAWRALSPSAQALYPWLKLEWRGPQANNNGKIRLSVRQAADRLGVGINTASRAFHDLQAKGFAVVTEHARLGVKGKATSPAYELTELPLPHAEKPSGRKLFKEWREGADFPVQKAAAHNPKGRSKKQNPVVKLVTPRHQNGDG
ncbi:hypothetical protein KPG71_04695 [Roseovarius sp. PS-C2]|uniref:hypothetical protein n=1 Tax=Roseovarius sp. PS-C2 TaxID=2820814 RepID=UPI001C0DF7FA|nr:hypothetical protein [Roseovarius sp. PS-C2]MBU3259308.1 hypothetical protein [Roseovarius sp. PS-C2]